MNKWLRRLRGIVGIGALWGIVGTIVGGIGGLAASVFGGLPLFESVIEFGLGAGGAGFMLGSAFAATLAMIERRRTLDELSPGRAAVWGALAGGSLPLIWVLASYGSLSGLLSLEQVVLVGLWGGAAYGTVAGGLAAATVVLARRAPSDVLRGPMPDGEGLLAPGDP